MAGHPEHVAGAIIVHGAAGDENVGVAEPLICVGPIQPNSDPSKVDILGGSSTMATFPLSAFSSVIISGDDIADTIALNMSTAFGTRPIFVDTNNRQSIPEAVHDMLALVVAIIYDNHQLPIQQLGAFGRAQ